MFPRKRRGWRGINPTMPRFRSPKRLNGMMGRGPQSRRNDLAEIGGRFSGQGCQHQRDHMGKALIPCLLTEEIAAEDYAERGAVREVEEAQCRDRNIELDWID